MFKPIIQNELDPLYVSNLEKNSLFVEFKRNIVSLVRQQNGQTRGSRYDIVEILGAFYRYVQYRLYHHLIMQRSPVIVQVLI